MYSRLRKRLTDKRTAEEIRNNVRGLIDAGIEPQKSDLIYIKLAEIEDYDEFKEFAIRKYVKRQQEIKPLATKEGKRAAQPGIGDSGIYSEENI
jgi:hypothetical protein